MAYLPACPQCLRKSRQRGSKPASLMLPGGTEPRQPSESHRKPPGFPEAQPAAPEMKLVRGRTVKAGVEESTLHEDLPCEHHIFQCSYLVTVGEQIFLFLEQQLVSECHLKTTAVTESQNISNLILIKVHRQYKQSSQWGNRDGGMRDSKGPRCSKIGGPPNDQSDAALR